MLHQPHINHQIENSELRHEQPLYVIGVCSNPVRFHSRYRIAREWIQHMLNTPHVHLCIVEAAFGDRHHEITHREPAPNLSMLQVRTRSEAWIKENMINLGFRHLVPHNAKYIAWIDMDVFFPDHKWALETMHQLQHFEVVQPWSDALDLGHHGTVLQHFKSFGYQHQRRVPKQMHPSQKSYQYAHTGFAWAARRSFMESMLGAGGPGPLMDWPILGSADHHMAFAMIGEVKNTIHRGMSPAFFRKCFEWQDRAVRMTHKEVGFVPTRVEHRFHGPKKRRYYRERWEIILGDKYNPDTNLHYDSQGVLSIVGNHKLEHEIRRYNRSRMEDSIEEC